MYLILAFIVVHLAGVFLAERKNGKGIVSDMINGGSGEHSKKPYLNPRLNEITSDTKSVF
jgi:cytochrome b